jgi:hypothetical protein
VFQRCRINSSIHGFLCGTIALKLIAVDRIWAHDVIDTYCDKLNWVYAMSTGYEIYDIITMIFQKDPDIIMWVHHSIIIIGYQIVMVCGGRILRVSSNNSSSSSMYCIDSTLWLLLP